MPSFSLQCGQGYRPNHRFAARGRLLLLLALMGLTLAAAANDNLLCQYRGPPYRAPTPEFAPGATTLFFTDDVRKLIADSNVLLVNVSPITLGPANANGNRNWILRRDRPEEQIPGSIWLPNVGYQTLSPAMTAYFRGNLQRYTAGNQSRPLLFYCVADCWMSWNAVKRAVEVLNYQNVYWYPYGTDGWREDDLELEAATPEPFPRFDPSG